MCEVFCHKKGQDKAKNKEMGGSSQSKLDVVKRMDGGERFDRGMDILSLPKRLNFLEKTLANQISFKSSAAAGPLFGLELKFEKMLHPMFINDALVIIKCTSNCVSSTRICTSRAFLFAHYALCQPLQQYLMHVHSVEEEHEQCPICMDRDVAVSMACGHAFCKVCETEWMEIRSTCPLCRAAQGENEDWVLSSQEQQANGDGDQQQRLLAHSLFTFLLAIPALDEFYAEFPRLTHAEQEEEEGDLMENWLASQLMEQGQRCPSCFAKIRIPPTSLMDQRLNCSVCKRIYVIKDLFLV